LEFAKLIEFKADPVGSPVILYVDYLGELAKVFWGVLIRDLGQFFYVKVCKPEVEYFVTQLSFKGTVQRDFHSVF
jgi:hypothetical protein